MPESFIRTDCMHGTFPNPSTRLREKATRVAFYSHDTMGMGHIRRNLLIASALVKDCPNVEALLIAGTREAAFFASQAGMDCVTLPALAKDIQGNYGARHLSLSFLDTTRLRSRIIHAALEEFAPDVFVVDKLPQGIGNELSSTLQFLKGQPTQCVLGLRDILDEPHIVSKEWERDGNDAAIESFFDEVWIYGDRTVYDSIEEYRFREVVSSKALFTGYLNQSDRRTELNRPSPDLSADRACSEKTILCSVGGGQDGFDLALAFVGSEFPAGWRGIVITGPFMPKSDMKRLHELAGQRRDLQIVDRLVETDDYLRQADRVVAMGGYNTVMSILSFGKPALIVPRIRPRREQWIRAERLANKGLVTALSPDQLSSSAIQRWLRTPDVPRPFHESVDMCGLERIGQRIHALRAHSPSLPVS